MDPIWIIGVAIGVGLTVTAVVLARGRSRRHDAARWGVATQEGRRAFASKARAGQKRATRPSSAGGGGAAKLFRSLSAVLRLADTTQSKAQELLVHAGIREKGAVEIFLGAKLALAVALPAMAVAGTIWWQNAAGKDFNPRTLLTCGAIALVLGLMIPNVWLRRKAQARINRVRLSLPDVLDLLIVCVEAGLGLDAATVRISREMLDAAPELCEEFTLLNLEIGAGKPRAECLRNLALRTGCDEVASLCARINQASKYGTNLGHSLRIHSDSLRLKRRQEAEERAAKTTVKLLFPLVFFIFPAIFVVILGPGVVKVLRMMNS